MPIKLSICIPTYNRLNFLPGTVDSILKQYVAGLQIVISDNCSTDGTKEWVNKLIGDHPEYNIKYYCWDKNMGADLNYMKAIEIADGEYCWFMGSDDQIKEGAVKLILSKLSNEYDAMLFCRTLCDVNLIPYGKDYALRKKLNEGLFDFSNNDELTFYLRMATNLSALFSYLSTIIIKKTAWEEIVLDDTFIGSAYSHVFKIFSFLRKGGVLYYSKESIVFTRVGNDSFQTQHINDRLVLDLDGYFKLANHFFPSDLRMKNCFWIPLRRWHSWKSLYKARINVQNEKEWIILRRKLLMLNFSKVKLLTISYSYPMFNLLLKIHQFFIKKASDKLRFNSYMPFRSLYSREK